MVNNFYLPYVNLTNTAKRFKLLTSNILPLSNFMLIQVEKSNRVKSGPVDGFFMLRGVIQDLHLGSDPGRAPST